MAANDRFIAYYRVSTDKQGIHGLGMQAQEQAVESYLAANGGVLVNGAFVECETGTNKRKRPELAKALAACHVFKAKLIVAKLDRLSRNVGFISRMLESDVEFVAVDNPAANRTMIQLTSVMSEWEARAISERTKAALQALKARGVKLGGEREKRDGSGIHHIADYAGKGRQVSAQVRLQKATEHAGYLLPIINEIKASGAGGSLRQIAAALNERNVPAAKGGVWTAVQVSRLLRFAGNTPSA
jgi:DNA invertase Pin-like site-specific DNA recombinase